MKTTKITPAELHRVRNLVNDLTLAQLDRAISDITSILLKDGFDPIQIEGYIERRTELAINREISK